MPRSRNILFSERNGYVKVSDVLIVEQTPPEICNAISSALTREMQSLDNSFTLDIIKEGDSFGQLIWSHLMHRSISTYDLHFGEGRKAIDTWIRSESTPWYKKLDLVEFIIANLPYKSSQESFIKELSEQFESLNFGYRILKGHVVEIVSKTEIKSVNDAITNSRKVIADHLFSALALHAKRPKGDYSNSIKESISAVEAQMRLITGKKTFGAALDVLESKGIKLQPRLKTAIEQLYAYTNQPDTGIRHSLMDADSEYVPSSAESLYMLVTCSAFVNYLRTKESITSNRDN